MDHIGSYGNLHLSSITRSTILFLTNLISHLIGTFCSGNWHFDLASGRVYLYTSKASIVINSGGYLILGYRFSIESVVGEDFYQAAFGNGGIRIIVGIDGRGRSRIARYLYLHLSGITRRCFSFNTDTISHLIGTWSSTRWHLKFSSSCVYLQVSKTSIILYGHIQCRWSGRVAIDLVIAKNIHCSAFGYASKWIVISLYGIGWIIGYCDLRRCVFAGIWITYQANLIHYIISTWSSVGWYFDTTLRIYGGTSKAIIAIYRNGYIGQGSRVASSKVVRQYWHTLSTAYGSRIIIGLDRSDVLGHLNLYNITLKSTTITSHLYPVEETSYGTGSWGIACCGSSCYLSNISTCSAIGRIHEPLIAEVTFACSCHSDRICGCILSIVMPLWLGSNSSGCFLGFDLKSIWEIWIATLSGCFYLIGTYC